MPLRAEHDYRAEAVLMGEGAFMTLLSGSVCGHCGLRAWPTHFNRRGKFRWCLESGKRRSWWNRFRRRANNYGKGGGDERE